MKTLEIEKLFPLMDHLNGTLLLVNELSQNAVIDDVYHFTYIDNGADNLGAEVANIYRKAFQAIRDSRRSVGIEQAIKGQVTQISGYVLRSLKAANAY